MSVANKVEVKYKMARFYKRIFANLLDFLAFALVTVALFLALRGLVSVTPGYQTNINRYNEIRVDSGLYVSVDGEISDLITFLRSSNSTDGYYAKCTYVDGKTGIVTTGVPKFIDFLEEEVGEEAASTVQEEYDKCRLEATYTVDDEEIHYYVEKSSGDLVYNAGAEGWNYQNLFDNVLVSFVDETCQGYLITLVPEYLELIRWESIILLAVEIPIAYLLSGILIYLIPPLIMKRGKMTLGKAIYQIGLADSRLLSCSWKRYVARWFILFFGEFVLSIFTFGIPFLISFTLMAFSKKHQGFPDYILGLYEVDCMEDKLYMNYEEITLKGVSGEKAPIPFKMTTDE